MADPSTPDDAPTEQTGDVSAERIAEVEAENEQLRDETDALQAENEQLRERLDAIEAVIGTTPDTEPENTTADGSESDPDAEEPDSSPGRALSRRGAIAVLASLGLLGIGTQPALAASEGDTLTFGNSFAGTPSNSNYGLELIEQSSSGFSYGVRGISESTDGRGVFGYASADSGETYGLWGKADSTSGTGLSGTATASEGITKGVLGTSKSDQGLGVFGRAVSSSGAPSGVKGQATGSGDGATGVTGEATNSSGATIGVEGTTQSSDTAARGVQGSATGDNVGVDGRVYADTESNLPSLISDTAAGVFGRSDKNLGIGVAGYSTNFHGIRGQSQSSNHAGVQAVGSDGAKAIEASGDVEIGGSQSIMDLGTSAYLSSDQSIPDSSITTIEFDATVTDDFIPAFDTDTGEFTVPEDGDYHVATSVDWLDRLPGGTRHDIFIRENGFDRARLFQQVQGASSESALVHDHLSKTLYDLFAGDVITVEVCQDSGSSQDVSNGREDTYVTIDKIG